MTVGRMISISGLVWSIFRLYQLSFSIDYLFSAAKIHIHTCIYSWCLSHYVQTYHTAEATCHDSEVSCFARLSIQHEKIWSLSQSNDKQSTCGIINEWHPRLMSIRMVWYGRVCGLLDYNNVTTHLPACHKTNYAQPHHHTQKILNPPTP